MGCIQWWLSERLRTFLLWPFYFIFLYIVDKLIIFIQVWWWRLHWDIVRLTATGTYYYHYIHYCYCCRHCHCYYHHHYHHYYYYHHYHDYYCCCYQIIVTTHIWQVSMIVNAYMWSWLLINVNSRMPWKFILSYLALAVYPMRKIYVLWFEVVKNRPMIHMLQGQFTDIDAISRCSKCQWSKSENTRIYISRASPNNWQYNHIKARHDKIVCKFLNDIVWQTRLVKSNHAYVS